MKPLFTGLSPNAEGSDVVRALALLCAPWRWKRGTARMKLEKHLFDYFGTPSVFAFESGRTSLMVALDALGLSRDDEVLLQAYTCVAVPNAVRWAGGTPAFIDCEKDTLTMDPCDFEKKITSRSRAVIVQHTFGNPGRLGEIIRIARAHNLFVIEDCAHVIGGVYEGKKLGTWGDMAILSFGRDKAVSSVFGGALLVSNASYVEKVRALSDTSPLPAAAWIARQLLHPIVCWLSVKTFSTGVGKIILFLAKKLKLLSLSVLPEERRGDRPSFIGKQMPNALCELALHQLSKLDRFNAHRIRIAKKYQRAFGLKAPIEWIPLRFVFHSDTPDALVKYAKGQDITLGDWYRQIIAPERVSYDTIGYAAGSCPNAESLACTSVNLPLDIHISDSDADRIISCVQSFADCSNH